MVFVPRPDREAIHNPDYPPTSGKPGKPGGLPYSGLPYFNIALRRVKIVSYISGVTRPVEVLRWEG